MLFSNTLLLTQIIKDKEIDKTYKVERKHVHFTFTTYKSWECMMNQHLHFLSWQWISQSLAPQVGIRPTASRGQAAGHGTLDCQVHQNDGQCPLVLHTTQWRNPCLADQAPMNISCPCQSLASSRILLPAAVAAMRIHCIINLYGVLVFRLGLSLNHWNQLTP